MFVHRFKRDWVPWFLWKVIRRLGMERIWPIGFITSKLQRITITPKGIRYLELCDEHPAWTDSEIKAQLDSEFPEAMRPRA